MEDKDLIRVTRCINCLCFIPINIMTKCGFSEGFVKTGELIKADGYCDNISLWVKETDYCSQADPKCNNSCDISCDILL